MITIHLMLHKLHHRAIFLVPHQEQGGSEVVVERANSRQHTKLWLAKYDSYLYIILLVNVHEQRQPQSIILSYFSKLFLHHMTIREIMEE